jgi:hypothetical protein
MEEKMKDLLETLHDECLDLPFEGSGDVMQNRRIRLGDVFELFNKRLNSLCPCGKEFDINDGQQAIAKMCQECLDNAQ